MQWAVVLGVVATRVVCWPAVGCGAGCCGNACCLLTCSEPCARCCGNACCLLSCSGPRVQVLEREVVVRGVGGTDAGLYQCFAANAIGQTQAGSYLGVRGEATSHNHTQQC